MHPTTQIVENHIRISRSLFNEAMRDTESKTYKKAVVTIQYPVKGTLIFGQNRENKISVSSLL